MEATKGRKYRRPLHLRFCRCDNERYLIVKQYMPADIACVVVLRCLDVGFPLPRKDMFNGITDDMVRIKCAVSTSFWPSNCVAFLYVA